MIFWKFCLNILFYCFSTKIFHILFLQNLHNYFLKINQKFSIFFLIIRLLFFFPSIRKKLVDIIITSRKTKVFRTIRTHEIRYRRLSPCTVLFLHLWHFSVFSTLCSSLPLPNTSSSSFTPIRLLKAAAL